MEPGTPGSGNVGKFFLGPYRPNWVAHMLPCERAIIHSLTLVLFITNVSCHCRHLGELADNGTSAVHARPGRPPGASPIATQFVTVAPLSRHRCPGYVCPRCDAAHQGKALVITRRYPAITLETHPRR
jgi:hypothetical protein